MDFCLRHPSLLGSSILFVIYAVDGGFAMRKRQLLSDELEL